MRRTFSRAMLSALGLAGCVLWTGCGGGGGSAAVVHPVSGLAYVRTADAPGTIRLSWTPAADQGRMGFRVLRRIAGDSSYQSVANDPIQDTTYTDQLPDPSDHRTVSYEVITVGQGGRMSDPAAVTA